jgi:LacI family transcriptional regulator
MSTIKEVAQTANVSVATVSNVLSGIKKVSPKLERRVLDAIKLLNFQVDPFASGLRNKKTMSIGFIVSQLDIIFFPSVIKGIQKIAEENDYNIIFLPTNSNIILEKKYVKRLLSLRVDGIIIDSIAADSDTEYFHFLASLSYKEKNIPVVSIQRDLTEFKIPSITIDSVNGGFIATQHLIENGCRKIACITGPMCASCNRERLLGYKNALERNQMNYNSSYVMTGDCTPTSGYMETKAILMNAIDFDGIFLQNDLMAIGAVKAMLENNIRVPEDVKVIGFDNIFVGSVIFPSISSIHIPKQRLGEEAARILINKLNGNSTEECPKVELPIRLIERQSTNINAKPNWELYL